MCSIRYVDFDCPKRAGGKRLPLNNIGNSPQVVAANESN